MISVDKRCYRYLTCRWCGLQRVRREDWQRREGTLWAKTWSGRWAAWLSPPQVCRIKPAQFNLMEDQQDFWRRKKYSPDKEVEIKKPLATECVTPWPEEERGNDGEKMVDYALINTKLGHCVLRLTGEGIDIWGSTFQNTCTTVLFASWCWRSSQISGAKP